MSSIPTARSSSHHGSSTGGVQFQSTPRTFAGGPSSAVPVIKETLPPIAIDIVVPELNIERIIESDQLYTSVTPFDIWKNNELDLSSLWEQSQAEGAVGRALSTQKSMDERNEDRRKEMEVEERQNNKDAMERQLAEKRHKEQVEKARREQLAKQEQMERLRREEMERRRKIQEEHQRKVEEHKRKVEEHRRLEEARRAEEKKRHEKMVEERNKKKLEVEEARKKANAEESRKRAEAERKKEEAKKATTSQPSSSSSSSAASDSSPSAAPPVGKVPKSHARPLTGEEKMKLFSKRTKSKSLDVSGKIPPGASSEAHLDAVIAALTEEDRKSPSTTAQKTPPQSQNNMVVPASPRLGDLSLPDLDLTTPSTWDKYCQDPPTTWRAFTSYKAKEPNGLSFREGNLLLVYAQGSGLFWLAEKNGVKGLVPGYFLEQVPHVASPPRPKTPEQCISPPASDALSPACSPQPNASPASTAAEDLLSTPTSTGEKAKSGSGVGLPADCMENFVSPRRGTTDGTEKKPHFDIVPAAELKIADDDKKAKKAKISRKSTKRNSQLSKKDLLKKEKDRLTEKPLTDRSSPIVMSVPNVQPVSVSVAKKDKRWLPGKKKDSKRDKTKTTLVNWENVVIGETISSVSAGSGTSVHVAYVDGFQCCMKELDFSIATTEQKNMLRREISVLEQLEPHRNVIRYLHHEEGKKYIRLFTTMYTATLKGLLQRRKENNSPLSSLDICFYAHLCLNGLQFLHGHGILHRDIKADNVFLILGGQGKILEVALGDFDQAKSLVHKSSTFTTVGTVGWMAPELFEGAGYAFPADIYSFGMLLFEMLALETPFHEESQFTLPDRVAKGLQPKIPEVVMDLPGYPELVKLHRACIAIRPQDRPTLQNILDQLASLFNNIRSMGDKK